MTDNIKPVMEGVFKTSPSPTLVGGYCPACGNKYFPKPAVCPHCLEPVQDAELSPFGTLHSFTVVRVKPPYGLPQPYAVGYVDLEGDNLRVFGLLDAGMIPNLAIGQRVVLDIAPIGVDSAGKECLRYYFRLPGRGKP